jgi:hypothetical protein
MQGTEPTSTAFVRHAVAPEAAGTVALAPAPRTYEMLSVQSMISLARQRFK